MSFILTPVYSNTLTGANQNPLDPTNLSDGGYSPYQILNHVGVGTDVNNFAEAVYIGTPVLSNDQFATLTIHQWTPSVANTYFIYIRSNLDGSTSYAFYMADNDDGTVSVELDVYLNDALQDNLYFNAVAAVPLSGDSFTVIAVGTTIALFKNSTLLYSGTDATIASGLSLVSTGIGSGVLTDLTVTNMIFGNASINSLGGSNTIVMGQMNQLSSALLSFQKL